MSRFLAIVAILCLSVTALAAATKYRIAPNFDSSGPFKAGSTIPIKISVFDVDSGLNVSSAALPVRALNIYPTLITNTGTTEVDSSSGEIVTVPFTYPGSIPIPSGVLCDDARVFADNASITGKGGFALQESANINGPWMDKDNGSFSWDRKNGRLAIRSTACGSFGTVGPWARFRVVVTEGGPFQFNMSLRYYALDSDTLPGTSPLPATSPAGGDGEFRYEPGFAYGGNGAYVFSLDTTGLQPDVYRFAFTVGSDAHIYSIALELN